MTSRATTRRAGDRRGFTLIEAVVSIGILVVLMTLIGAVFSITGKASSQSNAVLSVHNQLRLFRETLKRDLAGVDPENSALAIAGVLVQTYETPQDRANAVVSQHRADMLMFFTNTRARPFCDPADRGSASRGPVQVVYGHANLAELDPTKLQHPFRYLPGTFRNVESTAMNASDWHLARRAVMFDTYDNATNPPVTNFLAPEILQGNNDVLPYPANPVPFDYDLWVNNFSVTSLPNVDLISRGIIQNWYYTPGLVTGGSQSGRTILDPDPPPGITGPLAFYLLPGCADFKVEYTYDDPTFDLPVQPVQWIDPLVLLSGSAGGFGTTTYDMMEWVNGDPDTVPPPSVVNFDGHGASSPDYAYLRLNYGVETNPRLYVKPRTWPRAIRVSVRVYDPRGALGEQTTDGFADMHEPAGSDRPLQYVPIEMVFVHTF